MKNFWPRHFTPILAFLVISSCGIIPSSSIDDYEILNGSFENEDGSDLVTNSNASIRFIDVQEIEGGTETYLVSFQLNDGGSVETSLRANAGLNSGIDIYVAREGFTYEMQVEGEEIDVELPTATDSQLITLEMELSNQTPKLVIWTDGSRDLNDAIFRSNIDLPGLDPGSGIYWGISMISSTLTRAQKIVL